MSKRRSRKRTVARHAQQPKQDRQATLRRFTTKGWAISAQVLKQRSDRSAILDLMGFFDWLGDRNLAIIKRHFPSLPCRAGCAYCCYVGPDRPDLLPPEVFRVISFLENEGATLVARVRTRISEVKTSTRDPPTPSKGQKAKLPCLFLDQERCIAYPVRPMRCRAQHSPDADNCRQHYIGQRETMPLIGEPALLYKSLQTGLRLGLKERGLQNDRLGLLAAIEIAMHEPDSFERWLNGAPVFERALFPDEADEERHLAQFARQAKHQVRVEKQQLQQLLITFSEKPGAWASYSTTGVEPRQAMIPV